MRSRLLVAALLLAHPAWAEPFATASILDAVATACDYEDTSTGETARVPVVVDPARGEAPDYRVCKFDIAHWLPGSAHVARFRAVVVATGEVSAWAAATLDRPASAAVVLSLVGQPPAALPVSDAFSAPATTLAAPWAGIGFAALRSVGGQCATASGEADSAMYRGGVTWPVDQYAKLTTATLNGGMFDAGPAVRMNASNGGSFYWVSQPFAAGSYRVEKFSRGAYGHVAVRTGAALTSASVLELRAIGQAPTVLRVFLNGAQVGADITDNDPNLASGAAGIFMYDQAVRVDAWEGGAV